MSFAKVTCDWMNEVMWPVFSNGCNQCEGKARNPKWLRALVVHGSIPIARVNIEIGRHLQPGCAIPSEKRMLV